MTAAAWLCLMAGCLLLGAVVGHRISGVRLPVERTVAVVGILAFVLAAVLFDRTGGMP